MAEDIWSSLFREFESFNRRMDRMFADFKDLMDSDAQTYGYTMYRGPDGIAHVKEFGNAGSQLPAGNSSIEPFTDVTSENGLIRVVVEIPGADKDGIMLDATPDSLTVSAETSTRTYEKRIALPCEADVSSAKAEYNNGILEVTFKAVDKEKTGVKIPVE